MLLSIIVPLYNSDRFIKKCLESIDRQNFLCDDVEVIIVDDGSTDGSLNIVKEHIANKKIYKLLCKENRGVSSARNFGLKYATGKYIAWIDSDDCISNDWYKYIKKYIYLDYDLIMFDYYVIDNHRQIVSYGDKSKDINKKKFINDFCIGEKIQGHLWSKVIKRDLWKNIIFDERISFCEDYCALSGIFLNLNTIYYIKRPLYYYSRNENSITEKNKLKNAKEMIEYSSNAQNNFINNGFKVPKDGVLISNIDFYITYYYFSSKYEKKEYKLYSKNVKKLLKNNIKEIVVNNLILFNKKIKIICALYGFGPLLKIMLKAKTITYTKIYNK